MIYGQCNGSHILIDNDEMATIYGEIYIISNKKSIWQKSYYDHIYIYLHFQRANEIMQAKITDYEVNNGIKTT